MTSPSSSRSLRLASAGALAPAAQSEWLDARFRRLLLVQMAFGYTFSALLLTPKFAATALHATPRQIGDLAALPTITAILVTPFCGRLLDRGGWRAALVGGSLLLAASCAAFGFVRNLDGWVWLLRATQGVGNAFVVGGTGALVVRLVAPENYGRAFGTAGGAALLMNAVASSSTEAIAHEWGWSAAFLIAGLCSVLGVVLTLGLPEVHARESTGAARSPSFAPARKRRAVGWGALAAGAAFGTIATFTQPFAIELGAEQVATLFVGYTVTALLVRFGFGNLADRWGRRHAALLSLAVYALTTAGAAWLRPGWLFPLGLCFGIAHGLAWPSLNALAVEYAEPGRAGSTLSRLSALFSVGSLFAVAGGGLLVTAVGYPRTFLLASLLVGSGTLLLARGLHSRPARG